MRGGVACYNSGIRSEMDVAVPDSPRSVHSRPEKHCLSSRGAQNQAFSACVVLRGMEWGFVGRAYGMKTEAGITSVRMPDRDSASVTFTHSTASAAATSPARLLVASHWKSGGLKALGPRRWWGRGLHVGVAAFVGVFCPPCSKSSSSPRNGPFGGGSPRSAGHPPRAYGFLERGCPDNQIVHKRGGSECGPI